jgi:hypothetical protein
VTETISSFEEVKRELESDDFYCDISFASTIPALEKRLIENSATQKLIRTIGATPDIVEDVISYAYDIAQNVEGDVRSENDAALCACLMALAGTGWTKVDELFSSIQSSSVLGLWWPRRLVERLADSRSGTLIAYDAATLPTSLSVGVNVLVLA